MGGVGFLKEEREGVRMNLEDEFVIGMGGVEDGILGGWVV